MTGQNGGTRKGDHTMRIMHDVNLNIDFEQEGAEAEANEFANLAYQFADDMVLKFAKKLNESFQGWKSPAFKKQLLKSLKEHIKKGDMIDVGIIALMIWNLSKITVYKNKTIGPTESSRDIVFPTVS